MPVSSVARILYWTSSGMIYFDMSLNMRPLRSELSLPTSVWSKLHRLQLCNEAFLASNSCSESSASRPSPGAVRQLAVWQCLLYVMYLDWKSATPLIRWTIPNIMSYCNKLLLISVSCVLKWDAMSALQSCFSEIKQQVIWFILDTASRKYTSSTFHISTNISW